MDAPLKHFFYCKESNKSPTSFEKAGPHRNLFFKPENTRVAIVTCGGLCPGVNDVIQSLVNQFVYRYKVNLFLAFNMVLKALSKSIIIRWLSLHQKEGELWWNVLETNGQPAKMRE